MNRRSPLTLHLALILALMLALLVPAAVLGEEVWLLPEAIGVSFEPQAIISEEQAIALAKSIWASDFFAQDTEGGMWAAFEDGEGHWYIYGRYSESNEGEALVLKLRTSDGAPVEAENGLVYLESETVVDVNSLGDVGQQANAQLTAYLAAFLQVAAPEYATPSRFTRQASLVYGDEVFPGYTAEVDAENGLGFSVRLQVEPVTRIVAFDFPFG